MSGCWTEMVAQGIVAEIGGLGTEMVTQRIVAEIDGSWTHRCLVGARVQSPVQQNLMASANENVCAYLHGLIRCARTKGLRR